MNTPTDKALYERVKKEIYKQYKKPSAYRSGALVKKYLKEFKKKHPNKAGQRVDPLKSEHRDVRLKSMISKSTISKQPYTGIKNRNSGLSRWYREHWTNQRGKIGYQKRGDIYRPNFKITKNTPTTYIELSEKQIKKAMIEKKKTGRVNKF